jgi:hypothetical protein
MVYRDGIKEKANVPRPASRLLRQRYRGRHQLLLFDSSTVRIWTQMLTVLKSVVILRTALFWAITQRVEMIWCRRLETTYRSHFQMGPIVCPEMSVRNFHYSLRNSPEERSSHLLRGGSLNSRVVVFFSLYVLIIFGPTCFRAHSLQFTIDSHPTIRSSPVGITSKLQDELRRNCGTFKRVRKCIFLHNFRTCYRPQPASCWTGTGVSFRGSKAAGAWS